MTDFYSTGLTGLPGLNTSTRPRPGYPKPEQSAFRTGRYPEAKLGQGTRTQACLKAYKLYRSMCKELQ
jgi:hypothetical protein